jgi:hypothetical protein
MKVVKFFCLFFIISCANQNENLEVNQALYRQSVSDLGLLNNFTHVEMKNYYKQCLDAKSQWNCADSVIWEIYNGIAPMFEEIVVSGGGLNPESYYLMGDTDSTLASSIIKENQYIKKVEGYKLRLQNFDCNLNDKEMEIVKAYSKLLDSLKSTLNDAVLEKMVLGQVYYELLIFEGKFLLNGIQICQQ